MNMDEIAEKADEANTLLRERLIALKNHVILTRLNPNIYFEISARLEGLLNVLITTNEEELGQEYIHQDQLMCQNRKFDYQTLILRQLGPPLQALTNYVELALQDAEFTQLPEEDLWYGRTKTFPGITAFKATFEETKEELKGALEDLVLEGIKKNHYLPIIGGFNLNLYNLQMR